MNYLNKISIISMKYLINYKLIIFIISLFFFGCESTKKDSVIVLPHIVEHEKNIIDNQDYIPLQPHTIDDFPAITPTPTWEPCDENGKLIGENNANTSDN